MYGFGASGKDPASGKAFPYQYYQLGGAPGAR
jgi:hypothetical protein